MQMDDKGASLLDDELQELNRRFEAGEMKAFGPNQQRILKEFQDIRKLQAQLSMKQVALGTERIINRTNSNIDKDFLESTSIGELLHDKQGDISKLSEMLQGISKSIDEVNHNARSGYGSGSGSTGSSR
eukprot:TRINITY_DN1124_c0_g1_i1.p1 TRINITY_DN1124_c0_g1~~TRINITY_DN1124_c0_g1_i1.p1  ORF type:complete len:129 (+),score=21.85 TRINITY_DN1124_c0_g1_i1:89-475(+)